jgi:hypothetical protein
MRLTSSEIEDLEFEREELKALAALLKKSLARNSDTATGEELRDASATWELTLELRKKLKLILRRSYERTIEC